MARLNQLVDSSANSVNNFVESRPRINYCSVREEEDTFPNTSLLDPIDHGQNEEVSKYFKDMMQTAIYNGFTDEHLPPLRQIMSDHTDMFRVYFSSFPPAMVSPLKIDLCRMRIRFVFALWFIRTRKANFS